MNRLRMNRLTACLSAAVLAVGVCVFGLAPAAQAANQRVTVDDLGPGHAWLRLRDDPTTTRHPGVEEIAPLAAPGRFDGSLHLSARPGQQSQAAHYFTSALRLSSLLASRISYDSYVDAAHTTATATGADIELPMLCHGAFTTLSFQPQRARDSQGRHGVVPDVWQHWESGRHGIWRTSRAIKGAAAGHDATLGEFAAACDGDTSGVVGFIGNAGGPGHRSGTLDAYVDNLTLNGTTYDFAVDGTTTAEVVLHRDRGAPAGHRLSGLAVFRSPADGPYARGVGARILLDDSAGSDPGDVRVTAHGMPLRVTRALDGSLVAVAPAGIVEALRPGGRYAVPFTVTLLPGAKPAPGPAAGGAGRLPTLRHGSTSSDGGDDGGDGGSLTVTAELLATGFEPLENTGVHARASIER